MKKLFDRLYQNRVTAALFHTTVHGLRKHLADCESILDLGCGPDSPLRHVEAGRKVGVEVFEPYIELSKAAAIHDEYIHANFLEYEFPAKSFDAVVMIEVLEHLDKADAEQVLERIERIARKKIVITCPNGFLEQGSHDANPYQIHRSGWTPGEMTRRGYQVRGMAGLAILRKENDHSTSMIHKHDADILSSIRFRPRPLWFIISAISQLFTRFAPRAAFELMCVKVLRSHSESTKTP